MNGRSAGHEGEGILFARGEELLSRARNGSVCYTAFLTPLEQKRLAGHFYFAPGEWIFDGGYADAERRRMFFLPEYIREAEEPQREELLSDCRAESLLALHGQGSGYEQLTHRDWLGALLNLGVERDAIGDLCVTAPNEAVFFCGRVMADFLCEQLCRVGRDSVRVCPYEVPALFSGGRSAEPVTDTVASPRADAVVAALCRLSRERAQELFRAGLVEIDYEPVEKPERTVCKNTVITVRGFGKFLIRSLSDKTRKGRYRLNADRYR